MSKCIAGMTLEEAQQIKEWREKKCTHERIAELAYENNLCGGNWYPHSSQFAGTMLCKVAAYTLKENYNRRPWK